nr:MAG TPA: hypothetical protein [Caudoviricetes sp.]
MVQSYYSTSDTNGTVLLVQFNCNTINSIDSASLLVL